MFKLHNYTFLKPIIPRRMQILIRRILVRQQLPKYKHIWPIDPNSWKPPDGWTGWPNGKKFALVLTHDVETEKGVERCRSLMTLEKSMGFRSSYNFVAGDYQLAPEVREHLQISGFEVGVHGLYHKENPFKSRKIFNMHAQQINRYLKQWNCVGFRSPCMYHNLDYIHDLNIEYDASTFDTDPFEPQPDGVGTIFPFHVPGNTDKKGYVELPYTLPQDFLLFILKLDKSIDIWKEKLDWIVEKGGMVLLNTHPDYMNFDGNDMNYDEYPSSNYTQLLQYIREKYSGQYWHVLPRDMARFWSSAFARKDGITRKKGHVCMLAYSFYETDNRIRRYAETLAMRGDSVDAVALGNEGASRYEKIGNVNVYHIQKRIIDEKGKLSYLIKLIKFFIISSIFLSKRHLKDPYDMIHVHSIPDFEVFAALLPKLMGAKIILDIHDIVPELYASKFSEHKEGILFKALVKLEQFSIKFSDHVIISNHIWWEKLTTRSVKENKCTTIMNYPDESIIYKRPRGRTDKKFIMIYPGTLSWHQGLDIAIKAFATIKDQITDVEFHIYGDGTEKNDLVNLIAELGLMNRVFIKDAIPIEQIIDVMANADLGIVPKRNDPFGGEAFSTKTLEFMSLGIPIIVSETKIDKFYFNDSVVKFFKPDDVNDLAQCMLTMINNDSLRKQLAGNALQFIEDFKWTTKKAEYLNIVDSLVRDINTKRILK